MPCQLERNPRHNASVYRVLEARDLDEAVREFGTADPKVDMVLLDMALPGGGPNIFRELRAIVPDIPVVISSGFMGHAVPPNLGPLEMRILRLAPV